MEYRLKAIIPADNLGSTPARVLRKKGIVYINRKIWNTLSPSAQKFILLHEEGHHVLDTSDEEKADLYALLRYAGSEKYSLKNVVKTITTTLDSTNPNHSKRIQNIINHVLLYDFLRFNNPKAFAMYTKLNKPNLHSYIYQKLAIFLKQKGIQDISQLSEQEKQKLLEEFLQSDYVHNIVDPIISKKIKIYEDYHGKKHKWHIDWKKFRKHVAPILGAVAGIAGAALGVPGVGSAVNSVLGANQSDVSKAPAERPPEKPQVIVIKDEKPQTQPQKQDPPKKNKNDLKYLFYGLLVFTVYFLIKSQKR